MATVEHEEWRLSTSENDADQTTLRYKDATDAANGAVIDPLDRAELTSLHEALGAYLGLPRGIP